ncbi:hypothetical protein OMK64_01670 [Cellulomonas fimi]|uniref:hypothetical protein n=1 Tax=Cellulomonas fimi TaxID=1708 RepID=UPI00234C96DF|nr:hypothetical protein [Cellulomonas fimi]MDC7120240.1 hypothetical protein [Cellulomonas fimi]
MSEDEVELRRRLANVTTNRPALEDAATRTAESMVAILTEASELVQRAESGEDVGDPAPIRRRVEDVTKLATAAAEAVKGLDVVEANLRQGIAQLTAERQAAAATRAAHSAAWAAWAVVVATVASVLAVVGVAIWDHQTPGPVPTIVVQSPGT